MVRGKGVLVFLILFVYTIIGANAQSIISKADKFSADSLAGLVRNQFITVKWLGRDSSLFYYAEKLSDNKEITYIVNTRNWKRKVLFTGDEIQKKLEALRGKCATCDLSIYLIEFNPKNYKEFYFDNNNKRYCYNWKWKKLREVKVSAEKKEFCPLGDWRKKYSKDKLYWIGAIGNNLFLHSKDSVYQLTHNGIKDCSYSIRGVGKDRENKENIPAGMWIGNTHKYVIITKDDCKVKDLTLVNNLATPRPKAVTYKFAMPGDINVPQYKVYLIDADNHAIKELKQLDKYKDQAYILPAFGNYLSSGNNVYLIRYNRERNKLDLCRIDGEGGVKVLISEDCKPHFNEFLFSCHILNNGKDILWWSERTGKGKYYHYDGQGKLLNPVMKKDFVSGNIVKIDTTNRTFIFEGYGADSTIHPDYKFYYKGSIDNKFEPVLLTPGNGTHNIELSPGGKYIVDSYSRMDMAPKHQICDMNGKIRYKLPDADVSGLLAKGWHYPKVVSVLSVDSKTRLYGVVYLPFDMDKNKKYPIIANVYPGPQSDQVPKMFVVDDNYNQSLAQLGFIVINFSYRGGNPNRGRSFFNYGYGNLRDYPLADNYSVIQQVAKLYPQVDTNKVGIYGHSGGAFMTVTAMLQKPYFYKVGVAASGNYDNNIYSQWWGESFQGVKKIEKDGKVSFECKIPTTIDLASHLNSRLLLITGDMDNNVHPACTFRLAKALIDAGKRFDMVVLPGVDHGVTSKYYINLIRYYFVEHLLGKPQNDINIIKHN